jgi:TRAP-type transport system small permease protein
MAHVDGRALPGVLIDGIDRVVCGAIIVAMALMVAVVSVQVLLRYGFNSSLDWADDVGRLLFVASVFLAMPIAIKHNAHIGIGLLVERLPQSLQTALSRFIALLGAAMMAVIGYYTIIVAADQWSEMLPTLEVSVAIFMVPVAIGAFHSMLHLARIVLVGPAAKTDMVAE